MTRTELELAVRRELDELISPADAVNHILAAADDYATTEAVAAVGEASAA
jgi:hypothetical protein